jgi:hypothetical protein
MARTDGMFLYIGTYSSEAAARADYDIVKDLHAVDVVGTYDAAVITKDPSGKVHVNKDEMATRHGGWGWRGGGCCRRHPLPAGDHRFRHRRGRGRRERPPVARHLPFGRQGAR